MLSQSEIDALLSGTIEADAQAGEESINLAALVGDSLTANRRSGKEKQIRPYNFWSPDRFSKEQMRAVELVHEDLAERLTSSLPPHLRTDFRPRVVHIEQGRFDDFLQDLPPTSLFHVLRLDPLPGRMAINMGTEISWVILGRLLGSSEERPQKFESLTVISQSLMEVIVTHMLNDIKAAWSKVVSLEPSLDDTTSNQHWVQMTMGNARVMLVTFELTILDVTGMMNFYIPFNMLKPVANLLNPHVWISGQEEHKGDETDRKAAMRSLSEVELSLRVMLGSTELTLGELTNLQVGDVLRLKSFIQNPLDIHVADRKRFEARVGTIGKRLAVQITDVEPSHALPGESKPG